MCYHCTKEQIFAACGRASRIWIFIARETMLKALIGGFQYRFCNVNNPFLYSTCCWSIANFCFFITDSKLNWKTRQLFLRATVKLFQKSGFWSLLYKFPQKRENGLISITLLGVYPVLYITMRLLGQVYHFSLLICYPYSSHYNNSFKMLTDIYQPESLWIRIESVVLSCCLFSAFYQFLVGKKIVEFMMWLRLV